jgi:hypothetical protein
VGWQRPRYVHAISKDKSFKIIDERELHLRIDKSGRRHWRSRYYFLGPYPYVSLKRAREKREEAHTLIVESIDPAEKRKAEKITEENGRSCRGEWLSLHEECDAGHAVNAACSREYVSQSDIGSQLIGQTLRRSC